MFLRRHLLLFFNAFCFTFSLIFPLHYLLFLLSIEESKQHGFSRISIFSRVCLVHVRTPCPGLYRKPRLGLLAARSSARRSRKRARVIQGRSSTTAGLNDSWGRRPGLLSSSSFLLVIHRAVFFYTETTKTMNFVPLCSLRPLLDPLPRSHLSLVIFLRVLDLVWKSWFRNRVRKDFEMIWNIRRSIVMGSRIC